LDILDPCRGCQTDQNRCGMRLLENVDKCPCNNCLIKATCIYVCEERSNAFLNLALRVKKGNPWGCSMKEKKYYAPRVK
jgi:hypothetical protein